MQKIGAVSLQQLPPSLSDKGSAAPSRLVMVMMVMVVMMMVVVTVVMVMAVVMAVMVMLLPFRGRGLALRRGRGRRRSGGWRLGCDSKRRCGDRNSHAANGQNFLQHGRLL